VEAFQHRNERSEAHSEGGQQDVEGNHPHELHAREKKGLELHVWPRVIGPPILSVGSVGSVGSSRLMPPVTSPARPPATAWATDSGRAELSIKLEIVEVPGPSNLDDSILAASDKGVDAILVLSSPVFDT
jgi:hypothetical protein